jgi:hypothetical protein
MHYDLIISTLDMRIYHDAGHFRGLQKLVPFYGALEKDAAGAVVRCYFTAHAPSGAMRHLVAKNCNKWFWSFEP